MVTACSYVRFKSWGGGLQFLLPTPWCSGMSMKALYNSYLEFPCEVVFLTERLTRNNWEPNSQTLTT